MNREKTALIFFVVFLLTPLGFSDAVIKEFRLEPGFNKVQLLWKMSVESNVLGYKIQRGFTRDQLTDIDFVQATKDPIPPGAAKEYTYIDRSIFKAEGRTFYYRIVVLDPQKREVTSTEVLQVSPQISAVRHTWGSIKAMFR